MRVSVFVGPARAAAAGLVVATALLAVAGARADSPASLRRTAEELERQNRSLAFETEEALLELFALESRVRKTERRIQTLESRAAGLGSKQAASKRRLAIAREARAAAEEQLAERLTALYMQGEIDPIAVLLGAGSLEDAITAFDELRRLVRQDQQIIERVQETSLALKVTLLDLRETAAEIEALKSRAEKARAEFSAATLERTGYIEGLTEQRELNARRISQLLDEAAQIEARAAAITRAPGATGSPEPVPQSNPPREQSVDTDAVLELGLGPGQEMTVVATGYALPGFTAVGMPVGWGVVAVDPSVIPLGTRMTIPGYGEGIAADTGSAVRGAKIDLWFPTRAEALLWGVRTVTITLQ